ncbi:MAG: hypothetical protein ABH833_02095 [Parcubacteria group bacterium]
MATRCLECGKRPMMANKRKLLRGHYNVVDRYKKLPNLQWFRVDGKRIKICTSCIKAKSKTPKVKGSKSKTKGKPKTKKAPKTKKK